MTPHFVLQASGAMLNTFQPEGWTFVFGVFVTDQDGTPVEGLKKVNFSVWKLNPIDEYKIDHITEVNADFPTSKMPGVYRLQTKVAMDILAPQPQEFVFAIRAGLSQRKVSMQGMTTVPITYLGKPQ
jgi:hypothetical protein